MKKYADKKSNIVINPAIGMSFDSQAEAFEFYNLYSWVVGFGIQWNSSAKNTCKSVMVQEIVCSCEVSTCSAYAVMLPLVCIVQILITENVTRLNCENGCVF